MRPLMPKLRCLVLPLIVVAVFVGAAAAVSLVASGSRPGLRLLADGAMSMSNSRDGEAILSVSDLAPGDSVSGTVSIGNTGSTSGSLGFSVTDAIDLPGPSGEPLSPALDLAVTEVGGSSDLLVYGGPLDVVSSLAFEDLPGGAERTYRLTVLLPEGGIPAADGVGDNALQGASTTVGFEWALGAETPGDCGSVLLGGRGRDRIAGTAFADEIAGEGGADGIEGRGGDDCLSGGSGEDRVGGGRGADKLFGGPGDDVLRGGPGDDTIRANGDGVDIVDCGRGKDRALVGPRDLTRGC